MEALAYIFRTISATLYIYLFFLILRFFVDFFMRNATGLNKIRLFLLRLTNPYIKVFTKNPGNISLVSVLLSVSFIAVFAYLTNSIGHITSLEIEPGEVIVHLKKLLGFLSVFFFSLAILFLVRFAILLKNPVLPYQGTKIDNIFFKVSLTFSWMLPTSLRDNYRARLLLSALIFFVFFLALVLLDKFLETLI